MELSAFSPNMGLFKWIFRIFWQSFSLSIHNKSQNLYCLHSRHVMNGPVWATRGKAQTCWPRQTYKQNWETPSPHGFFLIAVFVWEDTVLQHERWQDISARCRALSIETTKVQGPSTEKGRRFSCKISYTYFGLVSVGKVGGKLLHEKEVGKEITNLKWLGVSFWAMKQNCADLKWVIFSPACITLSNRWL